jgi:hypothetical protein
VEVLGFSLFILCCVRFDCWARYSADLFLIYSPQKKKRGRKKKEENQEKITDHMPTKKKKRDRFNGMSEDEVMKRELPDHIQENLDILIVSQRVTRHTGELRYTNCKSESYQTYSRT